MDEHELMTRFAELERRLQWLFTATGHGASYATSGGLDFGKSGLSPAVFEFLQQGNKIAAIKQYREETGVGLAEAKDAIDRLG